MDKNLEPIFIFGASGHAKVVIDIVEREGAYSIAFLADDDPSLWGTDLFGYRVLGGKQELLASGGAVRRGIVAIGSNRARLAVAGWAVDAGFELVSAIHPSASIARGVRIGAGTVVMAGGIVNPCVTIGDNTIINTKASLDHDCIIGDGVHLGPGSTLCGAITVGNGSFICSGATVIPNLAIGRNVIVGAGATVLNDIPDGVTCAGTPAREISRRR